MVASRVGGLQELFEEAGCGQLVPPGDPVALADAIEKIVSAAEVRRSYEEQGRRYANEVASPTEVSRKTMEVYREVCGVDTAAEIL